MNFIVINYVKQWVKKLSYKALGSSLALGREAKLQYVKNKNAK